MRWFSFCGGGCDVRSGFGSGLGFKKVLGREDLVELGRVGNDDAWALMEMVG